MSITMPLITAVARKKASGGGGGNTVSGHPTLPTSLAGHWSFTTNGNDDTAAGNDWTMNGGTFDSNGANLDGNNDYLSGVSASDVGCTTDADKTIAIWIYADSLGAGVTENILDGNASGDQGAFGIQWRDNSGLDSFTTWMRRGGDHVEHITGPSTGTWYLLFSEFNTGDNTLRCYLNDASTANATDGISSAAMENTDWFLGANGAGLGAFFHGKIAHMAVWNKVLTSGERSDYYNGGTFLPYS